MSAVMAAAQGFLTFLQPKSAMPQATAVAPTAGRLLVGIVLAAVVLGQLVAFALGLWHPTGDLVRYVEGHRESWWYWHTLSGMVFVMVAGAHAALVWWLVPGRGRVVAVIGGLVLAAGIASFGAGLVAEASTDWYTHSPTLTNEESHELLTYVKDHGDRLVIPILVGLVLTSIGPVLIAVGLWLSRVFRPWVIVVFVISSLVGNLFGPASIFALFVYAAMCLLVWNSLGEGAGPQTEIAAA